MDSHTIYISMTCMSGSERVCKNDGLPAHLRQVPSGSPVDKVEYILHMSCALAGTLLNTLAKDLPLETKALGTGVGRRGGRIR